MKIDEFQCVTDLKNGSYTAFAKIYEAYADRLYGFVLKHLRNRQLAQDIVQDTFMRLWVNRKQLDCFGNLQGFIFAIAKYQVIDHFRRQVHEPEFEDFIDHANSQAGGISPEDLLLYDEFLTQLSRSKELLSHREREVYELSREKHLPIKDIAERLHISEQTVKNHMTSALRILRAEMSKYRFLFIFLI